MKVLHLFNDYLPQTQNWSFSILTGLPDVQICVGANRFLKLNFFSEKISFIEFPLREAELSLADMRVGLYNRATRYLRERLYPPYLKRYVGKVDLIHSHFATAGWSFKDLARKLNAPHIISFYGWDYERLPHTQPIWKERYEKLFAEADFFLCEGTHGKGLLVKHGCPPQKVGISHLGVRVAQISPIARLKRPKELHLVQVATFTEKKGHVSTIEAFIAASADCPNLLLTFVGGPKNEEGQDIERKLKQRVEEVGIREKVAFIPSISFERLHAFFGDYHVFIHPSVLASDLDSEGGAPVVLLDAQATGMPVISTNHCDIPDEVVDGRTGLLAPEHDVESLAAHIRRFYEMGQDEYDEFAAAARKHVQDHYDVRQNAAGLRRIYDEVLGR